jgi:hypothetical protein
MNSLWSLDWAEIERLVVKRCGGRCERCGASLSGYWETTHRHYNYLFRNAEHFESLLGLCPRCYEEDARHRPRR